MPYKDKERERARKRADYQKNKEYWKQYAIDNRDTIKANFRLSHVKRTYKLDASEYLQMIETQKNLCLICGLSETNTNKHGDVRPLSVDHCHKTDIVRGLLCNQCNAGLGNFKDNVSRLKNAVAYLEAFEENHHRI